jgi:TetR/AcrR family transcriptional regulator
VAVDVALEPSPRRAAEENLLDAAERLLVELGYAGITTRRLAESAGVNHGLVHYYFGSIENLLARVLERFTDRLIARQRAMYSANVPFIEKWRTAMSYLEADRDYQKVWFELQALAWNRPELRESVARVHGEWRDIPMPLDVLVALVMTFNEGVILERLAGISTGHAQLLEWIDGWLEDKEKEWRRRKR